MKGKIRKFNIYKIVTLLAAVLALTAILVGCAGAADTKVSFAGGSFAVGSAPEGGSYRPGDVITLPESELTREGYVFAGWSDGEKTYRPGERYTVGVKEVEFIAVWAREIMKIRFVNYDGSLLWETTVKYGYGLSSGYLGADPLVPDSALLGHRKVWNEEDGWEPAIPEVFTEDAEFTAKFSDVPIEYRIRYYGETGALYAEFYENYGGALKAPGKNPEKNVPESEVHVERYEFAGWKKKGEPDSSAVLPDRTGAIGTVSGDADFVPVFTEVKKIYTISAPESPVGYTVRMTSGVTVGGTVKFVLTLEDAYSHSVPHASVDFGGALKPVVLTPLAGGGFEGSIENVGQNGILFVTDVTVNRYSVAVNALNAEVSGLKSEYGHGETAAFFVVPSEHFRRSAPVVRRNGIALVPTVTETDGVPRYEYSFVVTEGAEISAEGVADVYTVTLTDGYGRVSTAEKSAGEYFTFPSVFVRPSTDQYDYVFRNLTEQSGKLTDAYAGGDKIAVWDDYDFLANFDEKLKYYDVTIRVRGEETVVRQPYGKPFSEFLPEVDQTIVEIVSTFTFSGWKRKSGSGAEDAPLPADATVTGSAVVEAVYTSAPTLHDVTFTYLQGGTEISTVVKVPYNTPFSEIEKPAPDDRTAEGKYIVWVSADGTELDGTFVTSAFSATAVYRIFVFTVTFEDETGAARPEWTRSVEWGAAAAVPTVPAEYKTDTEVFTFTGWSEDLASVKSDLSVRPLYERSTRYYNVTLRSEIDAEQGTSAELTRVRGDRTFESEFVLKLTLSENVDAATVKVLLKVGENVTELFADAETGYYGFIVTSDDTTVYVEGVGVQKFAVTLPSSKTYAVTALDETVVAYGGTFRFTVAKGAAYSRADLEVKANGTLLSSNADGVYTISHIKKDTVVGIPDLPINVYAVTTEKGEGIAEIDAPATAAHGSAVVWTVTLQAGYSEAGLIFEPSAGITVTNVGAVYSVTLQSVSDDVSIRFFGKINRYRVTVAGTNFTSDATEATVAHGGSFTAVLTLSERYNRNAPDVTGADARLEKIAEGVYRMTVSGVTGMTAITVIPILDVYTLTVITLGGIATEGDNVRTVREGETETFRFFKGEGYTQTAPKAALSDGRELAAEDEGNAWSVTVPAVFGDLTVTVEGILNVYRIALPDAAEQTAGGYTAAGEATARYGKDYLLTLTPDAAHNLTAPTVTLDNGTVLTDPVKKDDGYVYTIPAVRENYIVSVKTVLNVYSVKFTLPNGETIEKSLTHGEAVGVPIDVLRTRFHETAETADYVAGWTVDGRTVGYDLAGETAAGSVTYNAVAKKRYYTAKIGEKKYLFLETAIEEAVTGQAIEALKPGTNPSVELGGGKTIAFDRLDDKKEFELKSGVTLKLPYKDNLYSDFGDNDKTRYNTAAVNAFADTNPDFLYVEVLLGAGDTLNAYGAIEIGGIVSSTAQGLQGHTSGNYAQLTVNGALNVYGTLKTFGYVKGKGSVDARSGSAVCSPFVVYDYRGGTNTTTVAYKNKQNTIICPFNLYEFPNIQPGKYTIRAGAKEYAFASLYASKAHQATIAQVVAKEGDAEKAMFYLSEGAKIEKTYDPAAKVGTYTFYGAFRDGELFLKISAGSVSSKSFLLPVSYHFNLTLAEGAKATLSMRYKFMPGSVLEVKTGAKVVLTAEAELIGYQEYVPTVNQAGYNDVFKATEYNVFYPKNTPAEIRIDGELAVSGAFGGMVGGSGNAVFEVGSVVLITSKEGNSGDTGSLNALLGRGNFYSVYETTQIARGTVGGVVTEFLPGNSYRLS